MLVYEILVLTSCSYLIFLASGAPMLTGGMEDLILIRRSWARRQRLLGFKNGREHYYVIAATPGGESEKTGAVP
jgi:hypothetical protein